MEEVNPLNVSSEAINAVLQTLAMRGWSLEENDHIKAKIALQIVLSDDQNASKIADELEADLLDTDLRTIGSKSLSQGKDIAKLSYLRGPKIFQISDARDISVSSDELSTSSKRRMLRFELTDGKNDIVAIEFSALPSIPTDVIPGTKVRVENKTPIRCGILCLEEKAIAVLGGEVKSLHDEWKINQKCSGSTSILPKSGESGGPPQFEKLQVGESSDKSFTATHFSASYASSSNNGVPTSRTGSEIDDYSGNRQIRGRGKHGRNQKKYAPVDESGIEHDMDSRVPVDTILEGCSIDDLSESSSREVLETTRFQNQEASKKLLEKISINDNAGRRRRGFKHKGDRKQDQEFHTLDEWERMKSRDKFPDTSQDEDIARQLQNELEEESNAQRDLNLTADDIRRGMFNYGNQADQSESYEGRGKRGGRRRGKGNRNRGGGRFR